MHTLLSGVTGYGSIVIKAIPTLKEKGETDMGYYFLWIGIFVAALIIEGLTMQLVSIWFAVGALGALVAAIAGGSLVIQASIFVILSLVLFLATRPLVQKIGRAPTVHTNADSVIGMEGIVR